MDTNPKSGVGSIQGKTAVTSRVDQKLAKVNSGSYVEVGWLRRPDVIALSGRYLRKAVLVLGVKNLY